MMDPNESAPATAGTETSTGPSLRDELSAAFDAGSETTTPDASTPEPATAQPETPVVSGEQATQPAALEAPKHWSEPDKALFAKIDPAVQKRWIERETEQQRGLDTKFQEIAKFRKEAEELDQLFSPYARNMELAGTSRVQVINQLLAAQKYLDQDPIGALKWLAEANGVDLGELAKPAESGEAPSPMLNELREKVDGIDGTVRQFLQQKVEIDQQQNLSKVDSFADAKDEQGTLLHPYFDECAEDIARLMEPPRDPKSGQFVGGPRMDLETAYKKASRMNEAVWDKLQADKATKNMTKQQQDQQAKINKAKRAAQTSDPNATTSAPQAKTLRQELENAFEAYPD